MDGWVTIMNSDSLCCKTDIGNANKLQLKGVRVPSHSQSCALVQPR